MKSDNIPGLTFFEKIALRIIDPWKRNRKEYDQCEAKYLEVCRLLGEDIKEPDNREKLQHAFDITWNYL